MKNQITNEQKKELIKYFNSEKYSQIKDRFIEIFNKCNFDNSEKIIRNFANDEFYLLNYVLIESPLDENKLGINKENIPDLIFTKDNLILTINFIEKHLIQSELFNFLEQKKFTNIYSDFYSLNESKGDYYYLIEGYKNIIIQLMDNKRIVVYFTSFQKVNFKLKDKNDGNIERAIKDRSNKDIFILNFIDIKTLEGWFICMLGLHDAKKLLGINL